MQAPAMPKMPTQAPSKEGHSTNIFGMMADWFNPLSYVAEFSKLILPFE
jgi:hypothetical protein